MIAPKFPPTINPKNFHFNLDIWAAKIFDLLLWWMTPSVIGGERLFICNNRIFWLIAGISAGLNANIESIKSLLCVKMHQLYSHKIQCNAKTNLSQLLTTYDWKLSENISKENMFWGVWLQFSTSQIFFKLNFKNKSFYKSDWTNKLEHNLNVHHRLSFAKEF